jgi:DNA polymerase III delta subunit
LEALPEGRYQKIDLPNIFKLPADAAGLCMEEARERRKILPPELAEALVSLAGTDLGFLSQEVKKLCTLLDYESEKVVKKEHLAASITRLGEASVVPLIEAVGGASTRRVSIHLNRIYRSHAHDPTIKVVRFMAPTAAKWMSAAYLHESSVPPKLAAPQMDAHPWYYRNKLLPVAKLWGQERLFGLLGVLSVSERQVFKGSVSTWDAFSARILGLCRQVRET